MKRLIIGVLLGITAVFVFVPTTFAQCPPSSPNMVVGPADCTSPLSNGAATNLTLDGDLNVGAQTSAIFVNSDLNVTGTGEINVVSSSPGFIDGVAVWTYGNVNYTATGNVNAGDYGLFVLGDTTYSGGATITAAVAIQSYYSTRSDTITVTNGTLIGTSGTAISAGSGNDRVNITVSGVTLTGTIDGAGEVDTLELIGPTEDVAGYNFFAGCVANPASCSGAGPFTVTANGKSFTFSNFEAFVNSMILPLLAAPSEAPNISLEGSITYPYTICDTGMVKIFRLQNGDLDVFSGFNVLPPNGFFVGRVVLLDLLGGVTRFSDTGEGAQNPDWYIIVSLQSNSKLNLQVYDSQNNPVGNSCIL